MGRGRADKMDMKALKKELNELRKEIRYHNDRYYNQDDPVISDYEYDQLMLRLKAIEETYPELITPNSPTQNSRGRRQAGSGGVGVSRRSHAFLAKCVFPKRGHSLCPQSARGVAPCRICGGGEDRRAFPRASLRKRILGMRRHAG